MYRTEDFVSNQDTVVPIVSFILLFLFFLLKSQIFFYFHSHIKVYYSYWLIFLVRVWSLDTPKCIYTNKITLITFSSVEAVNLCFVKHTTYEDVKANMLLLVLVLYALNTIHCTLWHCLLFFKKFAFGYALISVSLCCDKNLYESVLHNMTLQY